MLNCLLCLQISKNAQSSIIFNSNEWQESNVEYIIEKHLWKVETLNNHSHICQSCWQELYNFHNFYVKLEKAHANLNMLIKSEVDSDDVSSDKPDLLEQIFIVPEVLILKEKNPLEIGENKCVEEVTSLKNTVKRKRPLRRSTHNKQTYKNNYSTYETEKNTTEINNESNKLKVGVIFNDRNDSFESDDDNSLTATDISNLDQMRQKRDKFISENFQITCSLCQISLPTFSIMTTHYKEEHNQRGYATCCDQKLYSRTEIVDHIKIHRNPEYFKCKYCGKTSTSRTCLKMHVKNVHENKNVECNICGKSLSTELSLKRHKLLHEAKNIEKIPCQQCDKSYMSKLSLDNHIRLIHSRKPIICDLCGKPVKNNYTFKLHMLKHEGKAKPAVNCEVCGRILSDMGCLKRHMRSYHPPNGIKSEFNCPVCKKIFSSTSNLKSHIKSVHENKYERKCTLCEKTFKKPAALKDHMAYHTGKPLRACGFCPKTFYSNGNMHAHRKKAHPIQWQESIREKFSGNKINVQHQ